MTNAPWRSEVAEGETSISLNICQSPMMLRTIKECRNYYSKSRYLVLNPRRTKLVVNQDLMAVIMLGGITNLTLLGDRVVWFTNMTRAKTPIAAPIYRILIDCHHSFWEAHKIKIPAINLMAERDNVDHLSRINWGDTRDKATCCFDGDSKDELAWIGDKLVEAGIINSWSAEWL